MWKVHSITQCDCVWSARVCRRRAYLGGPWPCPPYMGQRQPQLHLSLVILPFFRCRSSSQFFPYGCALVAIDLVVMVPSPPPCPPPKAWRGTLCPCIHLHMSRACWRHWRVYALGSALDPYVDGNLAAFLLCSAVLRMSSSQALQLQTSHERTLSCLSSLSALTSPLPSSLCVSGTMAQHESCG